MNKASEPQKRLVEQDYGVISRTLGVTANPKLARSLVRRLRIDDTMVVTDIGCGAAGDAASIARWTGARVIGIDSSGVMLSLANRRIEPIVASATALPLRHASMDAAFSVNLLQLLRHRRPFFAEVARILRPGARLALPITTHQQLRSRFLNRFFPDLPRVERSRYPRLAVLRDELKASGFGVLKRYRLDLGVFTVNEQYLERQRTGIVSGLSLLPAATREKGFLDLERFIAGSRAKGRMHRVRLLRCLVVAQNGAT